MMDADTSFAQERIGKLCHQFKMPALVAQSVAHFTAAGHGDALSRQPRKLDSFDSLLRDHWGCLPQSRPRA